MMGDAAAAWRRAERPYGTKPRGRGGTAVRTPRWPAARRPCRGHVGVMWVADVWMDRLWGWIDGWMNMNGWTDRRAGSSPRIEI